MHVAAKGEDPGTNRLAWSLHITIQVALAADLDRYLIVVRVPALVHSQSIKTSLPSTRPSSYRPAIKSQASISVRIGIGDCWGTLQF